MNRKPQRALAWRWAALVLLIAAAGVRVALLGVDARLHPDEALFATQARAIARGLDPLLRGADVDKPPLTLYTLALSFRALGVHEWSARLPNVFFSTLSVAALYALARALYRDRAAAWSAAALWAFSPYALGFAATAFTDVQATFWVLLGLGLAARGRWGRAGVALALGVACKTSAWQAVPLALVLGALAGVGAEDAGALPPRPQQGTSSPAPPADRAARARRRSQRARPAGGRRLGIRSVEAILASRRGTRREAGSRGVLPLAGVWGQSPHVLALTRLAVPLALGVGALALWDAARAPRSFWALARAHNMPDRLVRSDEVGARLSAWLGWARWAVGAEWLAVVLALGVGALLARDLRRRDRAAALDWALAGYGLTWLGAYWLVAFNTYDRYLYPLVPLLLILAARALVSAWRTFGARRSVALLLIVAVGAGSLPATRAALRGELPLGGDRGQHDGIDALAAYLNAELAGAVVYDHWLGWELGYYLGASPRVQLRYMPQPEALADDLRAVEQPRYLVAPQREAAFWLGVLRGAGFCAAPTYAVGRFAVYLLQPCYLTPRSLYLKYCHSVG